MVKLQPPQLPRKDRGLGQVLLRFKKRIEQHSKQFHHYASGSELKNDLERLVKQTPARLPSWASVLSLHPGFLGFTCWGSVVIYLGLHKEKDDLVNVWGESCHQHRVVVVFLIDAVTLLAGLLGNLICPLLAILLRWVTPNPLPTPVAGHGNESRPPPITRFVTKSVLKANAPGLLV